MKISKSRPRVSRLFWLLCCLMGLAACQSASSPTQVVEAYVQARVKGDANQMIALSCAAWEPQARVEAVSLANRNPQLQSMSCSEASKDGNSTYVACTGKILTSYSGESREFNLADRQFKVTDGKMCGYKP